VRPHDNPYTPNAGARPPALVGRDEELEAFEVLLDRLRRGHTEQSMLITGLRGVGKTVLLTSFEERARERDWTTVEAEITKGTEFGARMGQLVRRALLQLAPRARWEDRARRAAAVLKSFQLTVTPEGALTAGLPQLPRLAGEAKSYAERLFKFPSIGRLSAAEAERALVEPAEGLGVRFEREAVSAVIDYTEGYPYFLQEYGKSSGTR
jgi:hypothetical protein